MDVHALSLADKADPAHTALVVVDYQNDFVAEGGAFDQTGLAVDGLRAIAPSIRSVLDAARSAGVAVVFVQAAYSTEDDRYLSPAMLDHTRRTSGGRYHRVPLCQPGTWGCDFYDDIRPAPGEPVVVKHRYSAFFDTDLDLLLRAKGIRTVVIAGVTTECCVESTVRDAFFRDYYVVVPRDCVACYGEGQQESALERIDRLFGQVASGDDLLSVWEPPAQREAEGDRTGRAV